MIRKILLSIITFLLLGFINPIHAQDNTIVVSPSVSYVNPGDEVQLIIRNETYFNYEFELAVRLFEFNEDIRTIVPVDEEPNSEIFDFDEFENTIAQGEAVEINVKYINNIENYIPGIIVYPSDKNEEEVGVISEIATIFIDKTFNDSDKQFVPTNFSVDPKSVIFSDNSSGVEYEISSSIKNESEKILKVEGEIIVTADNSYLDNFPQSDQLVEALVPGDSKDFNFEFTDPRPWHKRIGEITFTQIYEVNDTTITIEKTINSLPIELFILLGIIGVSSLGIMLILVLKKKNRK